MPEENGKNQRREAKDLAYQLALARTGEALEDAVRAIAERTGAHPDTLRLALQNSRPENDISLFAKMKRQWGRMSAPTKRIAVSALLGMQVGLAAALGDKFGDPYGMGVILQLVAIALGIGNLALAKRRELGATAGAAFGLAAGVGHAFFALLARSPAHVEGALIIPFAISGAIAGAVVSSNGDKIAKLRFQQDPEKRREELLKQLIELQEELKQSEQVVTFLSVDVVDSTRIKQESEPLASEYSFGEYTSFVVNNADQLGGKLHSTAGDGVMLTFEHPADAFQAARRIQAGMLEFNAFRNKTVSPFAVRCGIHTGAVMTAGSDVRSVAFSHVLDVASHIQRKAPPGGIAVSEDAALYLPGGAESVGGDSVDVQGVKTYLWQSAAPQSQPLGPRATPPPPPMRN